MAPSSTPTQADATAMNRLLLAVAVGLAGFQLAGFPLLVRPAGLADALLILLMALTAPFHWALIHESIHGSLEPDPRLNRAAGRLLGILIGLSWDINRFGHLTHHVANRHALDRPDILAEGRSWLGAAPGYYVELLGGKVLGTALAPLALGLPAPAVRRLLAWIGRDPSLAKIRAAAIRSFTNPARAWRIRVDFALTLLVWGAAARLWGGHWPVLAASLLARFAVLSLLDNAHHYATPLDAGRNVGNTRLPRWASRLLLNQNLHGLHHRLPQLAWHELPAAFARTGGTYERRWITAVLRQLRGPVPAPSPFSSDKDIVTGAPTR